MYEQSLSPKATCMRSRFQIILQTLHEHEDIFSEA